MSYVRAMDSSPPPAPASACATLSLCWAAVLCGTEDTDSASFCCAFSWACDMVVVVVVVVLCGRACVDCGAVDGGDRYDGGEEGVLLYREDEMKGVSSGEVAQMRRGFEDAVPSLACERHTFRGSMHNRGKFIPILAAILLHQTHVISLVSCNRTFAADNC